MRAPEPIEFHCKSKLISFSPAATSSSNVVLLLYLSGTSFLSHIFRGLGSNLHPVFSHDRTVFLADVNQVVMPCAIGCIAGNVTLGGMKHDQRTGQRRATERYLAMYVAQRRMVAVTTPGDEAESRTATRKPRTKYATARDEALSTVKRHGSRGDEERTSCSRH